MLQLTDFEAGFILGLLVGEGHFGGDRKQPQVTVKMNVRHEHLLRWLLETVPGSKLYGPYHHGGRRYYQWIARGKTLTNSLIPLLDSFPFAQLDPHAYERYQRMKEVYGLGSKYPGRKRIVFKKEWKGYQKGREYLFPESLADDLIQAGYAEPL